MSIIKVQNEPGLIRDEYSKAIISTDSSAHTQYLSQREKIKKERERLEKTSAEIAELRCEVRELKDLVINLVSVINNQIKQ